MFYKNKKGEGIGLSLTSLLKLIMMAVIFLVITMAGVFGCSILTTSPLEDAAEQQLNILASNVNYLISQDQNYARTNVGITIPHNYHIVAFNSDTVKTSTGEIYNRPSPRKCGNLKKCLCLYSKEPKADISKRNNGLVGDCKELDVDLIVGSSLFVDKYPPERNGILGTLSYNIDKESEVTIFPSNVLDSKSAELTENLGFDNPELYPVVLFAESSTPQSINIYIEIIKTEDDRTLAILSPNTQSLGNREYYINKYPSVDPECNNQYLNYAIKDTETEEYFYCGLVYSSYETKLKKSSETLLFCEPGEVNSPCICGERAIDFGYCLKRFNDENYIVFDVKEEYCNEIMDEKCSVYEYDSGDYWEDASEFPYYCESDVCDLIDLPCVWNQPERRPDILDGECVSICDNINICDDYAKEGFCVEDVCERNSRLGCFWDNAVGEGSCKSKCSLINSCSDYDTGGLCRTDKCLGTSGYCGWNGEEESGNCVDVCSNMDSCFGYKLHNQMDLCDDDKCNVNTWGCDVEGDSCVEGTGHIEGEF